MNEKFRQRSAVILLACYVPVILTLGFLHKHKPIAPPVSGHHLVYNHYNSHSLSHPISGFCPACHFASGHVFTHIPVLRLSPDGHHFFFHATVHHFHLQLKHLPGKRAPPVSII
ncbi:MAG TPA: hypothetical protein VKA34_02850 [Balneolales bacterium]|nr:hypothetical protein [Balneolales bacterium]